MTGSGARGELLAARRVLLAALVLAGCGAGGDRRPADRRRADRGRVGQAVRRADDLQLAALHRQGRRSPTSRTRPGSRSSTSRTSTTTPSSSARCSRSSTRASRAAARSSSSPTGWRTRCTSSATCRTSTSRRCRTTTRTSSRASRHPPFDPNRDYSMPWQSGMTGIIVRKDLAPDVTLDLRPVRPAVQGQGRDADRDARHGAAGDEVRRASTSTKATERGLADGDRQDPGRRRLGPDPPLHRQRLRPRPDLRRRRRGDRLVGRRGPAAGRQPEHRVADARRRAACCGRTTW